MRASFFAFLMVLFLFLHGCSTPGKESFRIGLELESQNRLEESLSMYEDATARERDNQEYALAVSRVRQRLLDDSMAQEKSLLATRPLTFELLQQALTQANRALSFDRNNDLAARLQEEIKLQMNDMIGRADVLIAAATLAAENREWKYALEQLSDIRSFYPSYHDLTEKQTMTEQDAVSYYLKEADSAKRNDDMASVVAMLGLALEIQPSNQQTAKLLADAQALHTPENYLSRAAEAAQQNDWQKVIGLVRKAAALGPSPELRSRLEMLQRNALDYFMEKSQRDFMAGNLYGAYSNLISSGYAAGTAYDERTMRFIEKLTTAMMERGGDYESRGRLGNALVWYEKAQQISRGQRDVFLKIQSLKDKIRHRVIKRIAVMDFTPPSTNPDAGRVMTDNLLSYLTKNASSDVKIFARDVLGAILKEIELGQAGLYDIESAKKAGKLKGTDVFIFGSVLQYNVEKNVEEGQKMVNAVIGKKSIMNPAYQIWAAEHPKAAEEEKRFAPPQVIEEDIKEIVKFKVANHKKTANVSVSFRVIDVEEGEVVLTKTLKNKKEVVDSYSEGVEFANIPFKELKLPSDGELLDQVVEETISELGYGVISRFQNLQLIYANSAEMLKKKGDYEHSIERYIDAISSEEVKNVSTAVSAKARSEVEVLLQTIATQEKAAEKSAPGVLSAIPDRENSSTNEPSPAESAGKGLVSRPAAVIQEVRKALPLGAQSTDSSEQPKNQGQEAAGKNN